MNIKRTAVEKVRHIIQTAQILMKEKRKAKRKDMPVTFYSLEMENFVEFNKERHIIINTSPSKYRCNS